jgi:hypothetical protein
MDNKKRESEIRQYVLPAVIAAVPSTLMVIATVMAAYIGRPEKEYIIATQVPSPVGGTAIPTLLTATQAPILPLVQSSGRNNLNLLIFVSVIGFVFSIAFIAFYLRKLAKNQANIAQRMLLPRHIEVYLERRIKIKLSKLDNEGTLSRDTISLKEIKIEQEYLLLNAIIPYLKVLLENEATKDSIREEIVNIFIELGVNNAEEIVIKLLDRPNRSLQMTCVDAIGTFGSQKGRGILMKILKKPSVWDQDVVNRTIIAIRKKRPKNYLDILIRLLNSADVSDRTKTSYVVPALQELDIERARHHLRAFEISKISGENFAQVLQNLNKDTN